MRRLQRFIGDKAFYKMVLLLVIPMVVQQGITNFVSLVDNLMVGRLGTEAISGVAIVNQLLFVVNLTIFGGISGASIHGAQFFGVKDHEGVRYTFRYRLMMSAILLTLSYVALIGFGDLLIQFYLNDGGDNSGNVALTLLRAQDYLKVMLWGLIPYAISQCYSSTLRDHGETVIPMVGSILAVCTNLMLNWVLIFGMLGAPALGVTGAAVATVISRYVEFFFIIVTTAKKKERFPFIHQAFQSMYIPLHLVKKVTITSFPLLINEFLWSLGMSVILQNYSIRGLNVVAAFNIQNTISNLFFIVCLGMGSVISILVGQQLGAGKIEEAKQTDRQLLFFNVVIHVGLGLILASVAKFIPTMYNIEPAVKNLASELLWVYACFLPITAFNHGAYFTMRSGGKTMVTFLFDSVFTWVISIPLAFVLARYTTIGIVAVYAMVQSAELIKSVIGTCMIRSGVWAKNLVQG